MFAAATASLAGSAFMPGDDAGPLEPLQSATLPRTQRMRQIARALFSPMQRRSEVLDAWREWTSTVPNEVTSIGHILPLPDAPEVSGARLRAAGPKERR